MIDYKDKTKYNLQGGFLTGEAPEIWRDPTEPQALHTWANSWLLWKYPQYNSLLIEKGLYPHINFQRISMSTYNEAKSKKNEIGKWRRDLTDRGLTFYGRTGTILPIKEVEQDDIRIKMIQNKESFQKGESLRHTFEGESKRDKIDYLAISMKQLGIKTIKEAEEESSRLAVIEFARLAKIESARLADIESVRLEQIEKLRKEKQVYDEQIRLQNIEAQRLQKIEDDEENRLSKQLAEKVKQNEIKRNQIILTPEIIPVVVASSSLIPLVAIGLLLYSSKGKL
tara:strand:+ start:148 stop:996 length:849 start_codon:yes stop_codon:yes gene_type:complete